MKNLVVYFLLVFSIFFYQPSWSKPIVIAHRGASGYLPEHTLEAKALAYGMNPDYIEQDVVLTKDDVPVVLHDIHLDTVTNVAQLFPKRSREDGRFYAIDFTLKEIRQLSVNERIDLKSGSAVFPKRFPLFKSTFKISTFREEIELIQGLNKSMNRNIGLYTEIKSPAFHQKAGKDISKIVLRVLSEYGYKNSEDKIFLQCFDGHELKRIKNELKSQLKLVQLLGRTRFDLEDIATYADGIGPSINHIIIGKDKVGQLLFSKLVKKAHNLGLVVHTWTFRKEQLPFCMNSKRVLKILFMDKKVDGVFSDFPDITLNFLKEISEK